MERMQSAWEHKVRYDLSESGVEALTLEEITRDPKELLRTPLGYAEGVGREETRALVASFHAGHGADDVVITTGTSEANFIALGTLVSAGDEVVVVMPNYMQLHGVATALGARVREVWLREERSWTIDLDALAAAVNARTKAICVCTPNNPTGQILSAGEIGAIVRVAERWPALEDWASRHSRELHWTAPAAGAICFFSYQFPIDSMPFVDRLIRDYSTMIVPGIQFRAERHLRIGFGMAPRVLHSGLAAIDRLLTTLD